MMMLKEEFVGGEKYRRAVKLGRADAILMWLALKRYASSHPSSEGFVPDEDVDDLPGAPRAARKAIKALVDCGRLLPDGSRGYGLIEPAPGGWQMHDYLDHAETPEDDELRRERARQKKQQQRELKRRELDLVRSLSLGTGAGQTGDNDGDRRGTTTGTDGGQRRGQTGDNPGDNDGDKPGVSLAGGRPGPCVQAPAPTRAPARSQPNPTQPTLFCPDPESAREEVEREPEPERATPPPPPSATRTIGGVPVWSEYPKGWRWSPATAAAAAAKGVTAAELQEQVNWRTLHPWSVPTNDLDGELVHSLEGIIARRSKGARGGVGPPPSDPYAWAPIAEHRAFATSKGLDLAVAADAYRAAKRPDDLGTLRANEDFMRRLKCWAATGGDFIPMGPLRRTQGGAPEPARGAA
jgi:hypothetical protein